MEEEGGAAVLPAARRRLLVDKHGDYIKSLDKDRESYEYAATEHLRMSGVYWGLTAMAVLGRLDEMDADSLLPWLTRCQHPSGGFSASEGHDPHILYTLSAVQILALYDKLDTADAMKIAKYVASLQRPDGSFAGDEWGEIDTRQEGVCAQVCVIGVLFSYCAVLCLSILNKLDAIDMLAAMDYVVACMNFDGGFGCTPGNESHAGQSELVLMMFGALAAKLPLITPYCASVFCCVGALALGDALHRLDADLLGWWLCERQLPSGGLNGRPEKLADVCYSWWVLSSLAIIDRLHWIDHEMLSAFILNCQDEDNGGIADRPEDMADVFHTFFGIAGMQIDCRSWAIRAWKPSTQFTRCPVRLWSDLLPGL
eukprot:jgi/Chlat1/8436/Chrsp80S07848